MNLFSLHNLSLHISTFGKESVKPTLNTIQKKVIGIALFAFGCLAVGYLVYYLCTKNNKAVQVKEEKENIDLKKIIPHILPQEKEEEVEKDKDPVQPLEKPKEIPVELQDKRLEEVEKSPIPQLQKLEQPEELVPERQDKPSACLSTLKNSLSALTFKEQDFKKVMDIYNQNQRKGSRGDQRSLPRVL